MPTPPPPSIPSFERGGDRHCRLSVDLLSLPKSSDFAVAASVACFADGATGVATVSQSTVHRLSGLAPATVQRSMKRLEAEGVLSRTVQRDRKGHRSTDKTTFLSPGRIWIAEREVDQLTPDALKVFAALAWKADLLSQTWTMRSWAELGRMVDISTKKSAARVTKAIAELQNLGYIACRPARSGGYLFRVMVRQCDEDYDAIVRSDDCPWMPDEGAEQEYLEEVAEDEGVLVTGWGYVLQWAVLDKDFHGLHAYEVARARMQDTAATPLS